MKTFIFITGAPGSGKSTVAAALQQKLSAPLFEFGWIPEFRNTGNRTTTYTEDEALAFENLELVLKNYAKHDFKNVIVTDLENERIEQIAKTFDKYDYVIVTLRLFDDQLLKKHVLDKSRSSGYRGWQKSLDINKQLLQRKAFPAEFFIDVKDQSVDEITESILRIIQK